MVGADVADSDAAGQTCAHWAAAGGHVRILAWLQRIGGLLMGQGGFTVLKLSTHMKPNTRTWKVPLRAKLH
eukprot:4975086-Amphidinium_carterae.1